ncbi:hypothetical protein [Lentzea sp. NPDC051838]|uniref:hypothetical protein n=1 Tax=Lentzea sp. NPDC051838 TaxID=3154849 RepID=UPI00342270E9
MAILVGGIAINKISDLLTISAPIVLIGSLIALLVLVVVENMTVGANSSVTMPLVRFCLASLILGAVIGGLWIMPIFQDVMIRLPSVSDFVASPSPSTGPGWFTVDRDGYYYRLNENLSNAHGYGVCAALVIALFAAVAAVRKQSLLQVAAFAISANTGMSLVVSLKDRGNDFTSSFFAALFLSALVVTVSYLTPDFLRLFSDFLGVRGSWFRLSRTRSTSSNTEDEDGTLARNGTVSVSGPPLIAGKDSAFAKDVSGSSTGH